MRTLSGTDAFNYMPGMQLLSGNKEIYKRDKETCEATNIYGYKRARKMGESMEQ